jgi:hypothetical protein
MVKGFAHDHLVLFSGDVFSPSLMSTLNKGKQMLPVLNALNISSACVGNHDFDFGALAFFFPSSCNACARAHACILAHESVFSRLES